MDWQFCLVFLLIYYNNDIVIDEGGAFVLVFTVPISVSWKSSLKANSANPATDVRSVSVGAFPET